MPAENPIAHRLPGYSARHATRRARRARRLLALVVVVVALAVVAVVLVHHSKGPHGAAPPTATSSASSTTATGRSHQAMPAPSASTESWKLAAPLARSVVLPGGAGHVVIMGGATTGNLLAQGIFTLDTANGALTQTGDLSAGLDDAAGAVVGGQFIVFGGAIPSALDTVQAWAPATSGGSASGTTTANVVGSMPVPRYGAAAVTVGSKVYLVGGANGTIADPVVLSTVDGKAFTTVATLPVPVRSAAAVAVGDKLYVLGGVAMTGPDAGMPVDTIQIVNLSTHKASVGGKLPQAVAGAAAADVGGVVVIVGGDTMATPSTSTATSSSATAGAATDTTGTTGTIWVFDPKHATATAVGQLSTAVAYSGATVVGSTMWLVGGESNGVPVSVVQTVVVPASAQ